MVSLTRTVLWQLSLGIFDKAYAQAAAGSTDEHTYVAPDLFTAETPLGTYQGMTDQVVLSRTPVCRPHRTGSRHPPNRNGSKSSRNLWTCPEPCRLVGSEKRTLTAPEGNLTGIAQLELSEMRNRHVDAQNTPHRRQVRSTEFPSPIINRNRSSRHSMTARVNLRQQNAREMTRYGGVEHGHDRHPPAQRQAAG